MLQSFGAFFAVYTHTRVPGPPWRPMGELVSDRGTWDARMAQVRRALAAAGPGHPVENRVAVSITQLGLTARLAAPVLGLAVLGRVDPVLDLADVYWQPELGGPFPLSLAEHLRPADPAPAPAGPALQNFLDGPARAFVEAAAAAVTVAPQVLWGNVASTVHAAGEQARAARPDLAARVEAVTGAALDHPALRGTHDRRPARFRRRTCCLIYRLAGPARPRPVCGDCVLGP